MVSLHAFVDDSASDVEDRRLFLAAYINGAGPWIAFGHEWKAALAEYPSISYSKMSEAQNLSGQFRKWTAEMRDRKILRLARVISESRPWSVYCSVSRYDYNRIVEPVAPFPLKQPYFSCFWGIIRTAADYHLQLDQESSVRATIPPVDYVFDEQGGLDADAALWYQWLKASQEPKVAALMGDQPIFGNDKNIVALQAADMLAWHLRRRHERGPGEPLPILDLLISDGAYREIPTAMLQQWAKEFRRTPGISQVQTKRAWQDTRSAVRAMLAAGARPPNTGYFYLLGISFRGRLTNVTKRLRRLKKRFRRRVG